MKRILLFLSLVMFISSAALAQKKVTFRQSQARLAEPQMNVYVKPLIVDLRVINGQKRVDAGPFIFEDADISGMTVGELTDLKTKALYDASRQLNADVIVAATFDVKSRENGKKGLEITVSGYPAVYAGWRPIEEKDYSWVGAAYSIEKSNSTIEKVKALK